MIRRFGILLLALGVAACATSEKPRPSTPSGSVPIPRTPPRGEPNRFANISVPALKAMLGAPAFVRKDGTTEMWRYDTANCHAFFFLYGSGAQQQVRHIETLPAGKDVAADPACLNALKKS